MNSYFSKGRNKDYLFGCGAPECEADLADENEVELPDEFCDMSPQQQALFLHQAEEKRRRELAQSYRERRREFLRHQQEEGKI